MTMFLEPLQRNEEDSLSTQLLTQKPSSGKEKSKPTSLEVLLGYVSV